jgi:hypothetical protein
MYRPLNLRPFCLLWDKTDASFEKKGCMALGALRSHSVAGYSELQSIRIIRELSKR